MLTADVLAWQQDHSKLKRAVDAGWVGAAAAGWKYHVGHCQKSTVPHPASRGRICDLAWGLSMLGGARPNGQMTDTCGRCLAWGLSTGLLSATWGNATAHGMQAGVLCGLQAYLGAGYSQRQAGEQASWLSGLPGSWHGGSASCAGADRDQVTDTPRMYLRAGVGAQQGAGGVAAGQAALKHRWGGGPQSRQVVLAAGQRGGQEGGLWNGLHGGSACYHLVLLLCMLTLARPEVQATLYPSTVMQGCASVMRVRDWDMMGGGSGRSWLKLGWGVGCGASVT